MTIEERIQHAESEEQHFKDMAAADGLDEALVRHYKLLAEEQHRLAEWLAEYREVLK